MLRMLFVGLCALCAVTVPVHSADFTFRVKSLHKYTAQIEFYSQNRKRAWPGGTKAYLLKDSAVHEYKLNCNPIEGDDGGRGETICYGAWDKASGSSPYWGKGRDGKESCADCCYRCVDGHKTPILTLR